MDRGQTRRTFKFKIYCLLFIVGLAVGSKEI